MWNKFCPLVIPSALLLALLSGCGGSASPGPSVSAPTSLADGVLLTVDGYPVPTEEFQLFLQDERALTAAHFSQAYGAEIDADFWTREFDGQTPDQYAREAALRELLRAKEESILLRERGLAEDISYETLMADLEKTNAERADMLERGEVFYGLTEYDTATYYAYVRSQRWGELVRSQSSYSSPTLEELRAVYDESPDYFTSPPVYTCSSTYSDGTTEEREVSSATIHKEDAGGAQFLSSLDELSPGDSLTGVSLDGRDADVTLLSIAPGTVLPFEDESAQATAADLCAQAELYALVAQRMADAEVVFNQPLYELQTLG
jgi:hypothetical protein